MYRATTKTTLSLWPLFQDNQDEMVPHLAEIAYTHNWR